MNVQEAMSLTQIQMVDAVINAMQGEKLSKESFFAAMPYLIAFADKNHLSVEASMLFCAFFHRFSDSNIEICDLGNFYDCTQVKILTYWSSIEELVERRFIEQFTNRDKEVFYAIPNEVVEAIRTDSIYTPKMLNDLDADSWLGELSELLNRKEHDRIPYEPFVADLRRLIDNNQHLLIARQLTTLKAEADLVIFTAMMDLYVQNHDNHITRQDIEDIFVSRWAFRPHVRMLENGTHPLQQAGLIEHSDSNGQTERNAWKLTDKAKMQFLPEFDTSVATSDARDVQSADSIGPKQLFFCPAVTKQLRQLESLLQAERFETVQANLARHGMRRGFACIFYGAPGTGKTETVLQLARRTGRGIMMVDVPNLRDKFVGETEKNTKAIFEKYRNYCKHAPLAPILLFNEADAILCRRHEGAVNAVDKMENAMQNIILQEMENLEGILIATTNLTGNMDKAFERRFLYKIEFPKPTPDESKHIWHSMLPELTEQEALELARQYSFSGGQIENIARKQIVNAVLEGEENVNLESVHEACRTELFSTSTSRKIGF